MRHYYRWRGCFSSHGSSYIPKLWHHRHVTSWICLEVRSLTLHDIIIKQTYFKWFIHLRLTITKRNLWKWHARVNHKRGVFQDLLCSVHCCHGYMNVVMVIWMLWRSGCYCQIANPRALFTDILTCLRLC